MNRKITQTALGVLLLAGMSAVSADTLVRIGQASPLTGPISRAGKDIDNGARLAIEDLNKMGWRIGGQPVRWELVSEDDVADPRTATIVAQKLVDMKVNGVVGHETSGASIPASRIYSDAGIPQISPSATNPKYTRQGFKTTFRLVANDEQQGGAMGRFSFQTLKGKRFALIDDRSAYGQGLVAEVEKSLQGSPASVVAREYGTEKTTDWMAVLTAIRSKNPDVIVYGGMDATAAPLLQQMRRLGMKANLVLGDGACSSDMIELSGSVLDSRVYCTEAGLPADKMSKGADFYKRFKARFGVEVNIYAPYAYDAVMALAHAMKAADSTEPARYLPFLAKLKMSGVIGPVEFDPNGDIKHAAVTVKQYQSGQWKPVSVVR